MNLQNSTKLHYLIRKFSPHPCAYLTLCAADNAVVKAIRTVKFSATTNCTRRYLLRHSRKSMNTSYIQHLQKYSIYHYNMTRNTVLRTRIHWLSLKNYKKLHPN